MTIKEFRFFIILYLQICFLGHLVNCQSKPRLEILPAQTVQKKPIGKSLLLTCRPVVPDINLVTDLQWRDNLNMTVLPKPSGSTAPPMYSEVLPGDQSLALIINKLSESMAGMYYCSASYANTELLEISVKIETFVAITWKNAPEEQFPIAGSNFVVRCEVTADPAPTVDWLRNGDAVKTGDRYVVQTQGLLIRDVQEFDDGLYTCRAVVIQTGEFVERHIRVEVQVSPTIQLLPQSVDAVEEKTFSIQCNATGKPYPEFTWIKDSSQQNVQTADRFLVNSITGQMSITRVTHEDYGTYTCRAKNTAGEDKSAMLLNVLIRPRIYQLINITEPISTEASIICKATGRPAPAITFRRWGSQEEFITGSHTDYELQQMFNEEKGEASGTLTFYRLNRTDDGLYECVARNQGEIAYKVGHITVEYPPNFDIIRALPPVYTWAQRRANLSCFAQGFPNATIEWRRDGKLITEIGDPNMMVEGTGPRSDLIVTPRSELYYRPYKCIAINKLGRVEHDMILRLGEIPTLIPDVKARIVTATTITFNIIAPSTPPGLPLTAISCQYHEAIQPDWNFAYNRTWSPESTYVIEGLKPQTDYHFRFSARNAVGLGPFGGVLRQATPRRSEPEPPQIIIHQHGTVMTNADDTVEKGERLVYSTYADHYPLSWTIPPDNGEPINFYRVKYCPGVKVDNAFNQMEHLCAEKDLSATDPTEFRMNDLQSNTYYSVELKAHNAIGFSRSDNILLKTAQGSDMVIRVDNPTLSSAAIIGIAIGSVLLLLLIIDFICCMLLNAGLTAALCRKTKRSPSDLDDETRIGSLYGWRFPLPYCSGQLVKEPPPSPLPLPPPVKFGGTTPLTTPLEENEPLNNVPNNHMINSIKKNSSVEFDGRMAHSRSGEIIGKNSAV